MYSSKDDTILIVPGCPIQKSPDQRMFSSSPKLIAAFHVFHLHLTPRHPPFALSSLATILKPQISLNALVRTYFLRVNLLLLRCTALNKVCAPKINQISTSKTLQSYLIQQSNLTAIFKFSYQTSITALLIFTITNCQRTWIKST